MKGWSTEKKRFVIQDAFLLPSVPSKDMSHCLFPSDKSSPGPFALLVLSDSSDIHTADTEKGKVKPQNEIQIRSFSLFMKGCKADLAAGR